MIIGMNGRMEKWTELAPSSNDQIELPVHVISAQSDGCRESGSG